MKKLALVLLAVALTSTLTSSMTFIGSANAHPSHQKKMPVPPDPGPPDAHPPLQQIERLGSVSFASSRSVGLVPVETCDATEELRADSIRLTAVRGSVKIRLIRVRYANGMDKTFATPFFLRQGQQTPWMVLNNQRRAASGGPCLRVIEVVGQASRFSQGADVEVFGLRKWRSQLDQQDQRSEL